MKKAGRGSSFPTQVHPVTKTRRWGPRSRKNKNAARVGHPELSADFGAIFQISKIGPLLHNSTHALLMPTIWMCSKNALNIGRFADKTKGAKDLQSLAPQW
jgi:hypothetical protein